VSASAAAAGAVVEALLAASAAVFLAALSEDTYEPRAERINGKIIKEILRKSNAWAKKFV